MKCEGGTDGHTVNHGTRQGTPTVKRRGQGSQNLRKSTWERRDEDRGSQVKGICKVVQGVF